MLADADRSLLDYLRDYFTEGGHEIMTAMSGPDCLAAVREMVPDIVVLEEHLPWGGADGVMAVMREEPRLRNVLVIVIDESQGDRDRTKNDPSGFIMGRLRDIDGLRPLAIRAAQNLGGLPHGRANRFDLDDRGAFKNWN